MRHNISLLPLQLKSIQPANHVKVDSVVRVRQVQLLHNLPVAAADFLELPYIVQYKVCLGCYPHSAPHLLLPDQIVHLFVVVVRRQTVAAATGV